MFSQAWRHWSEIFSPTYLNRGQQMKKATIRIRRDNLLPSSLPEPCNDWSLPYREMARENELVWTTLEELSIAAKGFLNPILARGRGIWDPTKWAWKTHQV
jgi:hypothetical protein